MVTPSSAPSGFVGADRTCAASCRVTQNRCCHHHALKHLSAWRQGPTTTTILLRTDHPSRSLPRPVVASSHFGLRLRFLPDTDTTCCKISTVIPSHAAINQPFSHRSVALHQYYSTEHCGQVVGTPDLPPAAAASPIPHILIYNDVALNDGYNMAGALVNPVTGWKS